jgi:hypothetical protein
MIKNRGYGCLVFRYTMEQASSPASRFEAPTTHFANSYDSKMLATNLDFIMQNQDRFSRPLDQSAHGLVQIGAPTDEDCTSAASWWLSARTNSTGRPSSLAHPQNN